MRTPVCESLGIEYPIFAFSHCGDVVAAVSRAGGMGVLGAVAFTPDELKQELDRIEKNVDGKPYGVDVVIPASYVGKDAGGLEKLDLEKLVPEEVVHDLIAHATDAAPYFKDDLAETLDALQHTRISADHWQTLEQLCTVADRAASASYRRLRRR